MATSTDMNAYLAIVSKREVRSYTDQPVPDDSLKRLLEAGRATGSSKNRQDWRFFVVRNRQVLDRLAETVSRPSNLHNCNVAIAVVMTSSRSFDAGRAAQNMMLAAWDLGIGTCPNTPMDKDASKQILGVDPDWEVPTILSVGYPDEPVRPASRDPEAILARINRKPLEELTHWID